MDIDIRKDREDQPDDGALLALASMIDEDRPIDWDSEERGPQRRRARRASRAPPPRGAHPRLSRS